MDTLMISIVVLALVGMMSRGAGYRLEDYARKCEERPTSSARGR
jgi:hypothetical protein